MAFDAFLEFFIRHKFVVLFYLGVILFVFLKRKRFDIHFKIVALYRTNWGLRLMDAIAARYGEFVKLFGYISIGLGFTGMLFIVVVLAQSIYALFTVPNAPPALTPIIPGVRIPGVPESLFIPLVKGLIAIFVVAVIHEFSHGVVARAHKLPIKSTGIALFGPLFAAFVEPDEKELKKRSDVVNYSMVAAGPVSNIFLFALLILILSFAVAPLVGMAYPSQGIVFDSVAEGSPAEAAGLESGVAYTTAGGSEISDVNGFIAAFSGVRPGDEFAIGSGGASHAVVTAPHPDDPSRAWLGVTLRNSVKGEGTASFGIVSWFFGNPVGSLSGLVPLVAILSFGIGLANLLPIGPLDGGKMLQQALHKVHMSEHRGNKTLVRVSIFFLIIILLLLTPVFRETFKAVFG